MTRQTSPIQESRNVVHGCFIEGGDSTLYIYKRLFLGSFASEPNTTKEFLWLYS